MTATIVTSENPTKFFEVKAKDNKLMQSRLAAKGVTVDELDILILSMKKGYSALDNGWKIKIAA